MSSPSRKEAIGEAKASGMVFHEGEWVKREQPSSAKGKAINMKKRHKAIRNLYKLGVEHRGAEEAGRLTKHAFSHGALGEGFKH